MKNTTKDPMQIEAEALARILAPYMQSVIKLFNSSCQVTFLISEPNCPGCIIFGSDFTAMTPLYLIEKINDNMNNNKTVVGKLKMND